jgi:NADH dehydrogenase
MTKKKICILGGSGFVGREIINELVPLGYDILVPTRNLEHTRAIAVIPEVSVTTADVHDGDALRHTIAGCDAVINLIGILNETGHHRGRGFYEAHRDLADKLVAACRSAGVRRLVQMSALKANAKEGPSHYLKSKGEAEALIRACPPEELAWTIFQPSVIFGPQDSFINRFAGLLKISPFMPLARPNARFAPVYVGDVARAFAKAIQDDATIGETYQLCGPKVYSLREIVTLIRDQLGLRRWIVGLPDAAARLQARIFDFVPGKPFSVDNYRSLTVHSICDANGFERLGIKPVSLEKVVPGYLGGSGRNERYSRYRQTAKR